MIRAVLFDLDDTLFDHRHCARAALAELHAGHEALRRVAFDEFERMHSDLLEILHARVLTGEVRLDAAREERFRRLFTACGMATDGDTVVAAALGYRESYQRHRRATAGAGALLAEVHARAKVAVVSNNLLAEQREKLACCGLDRFVHALVVSEEAGVAKPEPLIFEITLARLDVAADEAVMVGDSWAADVLGARAAGVRAVWFNPAAHAPPGDDPAVRVLHGLEPVLEAIAIIFDTWPGRRVRPGSTSLDLDGRCA